MLRIVEFSLWASRFVLAAVFLLAGAGKLADPVGWRKALRDFSLPAWMAQPLMVLLPVLELMVAAALVPASVAWYGARGAFALRREPSRKKSGRRMLFRAAARAVLVRARAARLVNHIRESISTVFNFG